MPDHARPSGSARTHGRLARDCAAAFIVDAGAPFGYGHLIRCRELALRFAERTGRPVTFLVDDAEALRLLVACGLRAEWGAFGRAVNEAPAGKQLESPHGLAARHELVVLDLFGARDLERGWRRSLASAVVAIDRADGWALEADLIVLPGVTMPADWHLPVTRSDGHDEAPVIGGREHLILRREVRSAASNAGAKDLDVVAYLHAASQRSALGELAGRNGIALHVVDPSAGLCDDFPSLLARARVFVSGFGHSFYEALAVGAYPVAWTSTAMHARDALRFYAAFGLAPTLLERESDLDSLPSLLRSQPVVPEVRDGSARIVEAMLECVAARSTGR